MVAPCGWPAAMAARPGPLRATAARDSSSGRLRPELQGLADRRTRGRRGGSSRSPTPRVTIATKDGEEGERSPLDRLVKLTRESPGAIAAGESSQAVLLGDGDRLMRASIGTATDASLEVRSELLGKLEVPLDAVLGLVLTAAGQAGDFEKVLRADPDRAPHVRGGLAEQRRSARRQLPRDGRTEHQASGRQEARWRSTGAGPSRSASTRSLLNYPRPEARFPRSDPGRRHAARPDLDQAG